MTQSSENAQIIYLLDEYIAYYSSQLMTYAICWSLVSVFITDAINAGQFLTYDICPNVKTVTAVHIMVYGKHIGNKNYDSCL